MKRILTASLLLASSILVSGCGLTGPLERPAPMWGSERARYKEQLKQEAAAKAEAKAPRPRVEIPVEGAKLPAAPTESAPANSGTVTPGEPDVVTPDISNSGGALPPVDDATSSSSGYSRY